MLLAFVCATVVAQFPDCGTDPVMVAGGCLFSDHATIVGSIVCEGTTADTFETRLVFTDPTADRAVTFPDAASNTVRPLTCGGTDKVSAIAATGVITCTADTGGSLVVEEADLVPTISNVDTIQFDQADGFTVTDETGGNVQIDLAAIPDSVLASSYSGVGACGVNTWASTLSDNAAPTCTQPGFSNLSGAATDAQVPNTITIDLATTATTANAGDTATAFFSAGAIEASRGGTADDTSATTGVPRIAAGNWTYDAGVSHLASSTSADLRGALSDEVGTGAAMFGIVSTMADDLTCTGSQVVRRNAGDTAFECATLSSVGASLTRVAGSSGAAGVDITWQNLTGKCAANATTTLAICMTTTGVGAGTWRFTYTVIYQSAATTTGVDFAINHTGTVGAFVASSWYTTSGGAAANALADQVQSNTANLSEGKSARAINTKFGSTLGVDTLSANMLMVIEGVIVVTVTGSLELKHASEVAASSQVMADSTLELLKIE